jgi:hypothetical protein
VQNLRLGRSGLVALSFVILSVGSAFYVSAATINYLRLYPALSNVQFQLENLAFLNGPSPSQYSLTARIVVANPTDYSGFRLNSVSFTNLFFYLRSNASKTLFSAPNSLSSSEALHTQLGPNSVVSESLPIPLTNEQANELASFNTSHYGDVMGSLELRVDILTFLEATTGSVPFTGTQNITLSSS